MSPSTPEETLEADLAHVITSWRLLPVYIITAILALLDAAVATSEFPPSHDGKVIDATELARLLHVSQLRMMQIMNLLNFAWDVREFLLYLPPVEQGRDSLTERHLRAIVSIVDWGRQRRLWMKVVNR
ncbi:hypothetical protein [Symmachiella dynata]|uniref:hypothetical protein n=1 Tax=Symmachiella dynata TaxID=2527995 RepID=UPI0030EC9C3F